MRATFAVYLEMSLEARLPGFWEGISQYEFCDSLNPGNFRIRQEIARFECEDLADDRDRARAQQVVERAGWRIAIEKMRQMAGGTPLDVLAARSLCHLAVVEVENAPNPERIHGMEGENPSVLCPICNSPMKQRPGYEGKPFWGCSNYPRCKGKRNISK